MDHTEKSQDAGYEVSVIAGEYPLPDSKLLKLKVKDKRYKINPMEPSICELIGIDPDPLILKK
jgi:hypothetical protein